VNDAIPSLASVLFAWTAVHTFVSAYSLALFWRIRPNALYGGFATASVGGAVYACGGALLVMATDVADAVVAQRAQMVGVSVILAGAGPVVYALANRPAPLVVRVAMGWAVLGVVLALTSLPFDPSHPTGGPQAWAWPQAELRLAGIAQILGITAILVWGLIDIIRHGGLQERDLRLVLLIITPALLAWVVAMTRRVAGAPPLFLFEHASVVASVGVSHVLLGRFVRLDDELRERTRELSRSYDDLQAAQEELVRTEQLAAVGELSAVIAHEVRHPLRTLERAVDSLLDSHEPRADQGHLLETLDEQADRLNRLVRDLLAYARPMAPQRETLDVVDLVRSAAAMPPDRAQDILVKEELQDDLPPMDGDPDLLLKAFRNIVENALQAMPSGGQLTLTSSPAHLPDGAPAVTVSFQDTGEGMDPLVRERARDPFFTTRPAGTGLGLAIVERVVYAHGGTIDMDSSYGGGTTVSITLPVDRRSHPSLLPPRPNAPA
jgi:signal transduction histidine kinase